MCGLAGFLGYAGLTAYAATDVAARMADSLVHRGPDGGGVWLDDAAEVALSHRRLSVLELSSAGAQPMQSPCGRYVVAFNGEIYNHLELRKELVREGGFWPEKMTGLSSGFAWHGHSDTETLLGGFSQWGIRPTIERCVGMFAFAVWDRTERLLTLGRDRLGEKPLYFGWQGQGDAATFVFGSELSALKAHPTFVANINRDALHQLIRYSYIPAPQSIYKGIFKLPPGHLLSVSLSKREPILTEYWSLLQAAERGVAVPFSGSEHEAVDALEQLLKNAVHQQMVADVPLGAFLSGGVDSSTVVALMQAQSASPIKTFTIGFNESAHNEAIHAKAVAQHLGTEHTELYVTARQALDVIARIPQLYSEPFADSSQIPTFLVSQLAHQHVKVALSGDAGDELFCGYSRYTLAQRLWQKIGRLPRVIRMLAASSIRSVPVGGWNALLNAVPVMPASLRRVNLGDKLHKSADLLTAVSIEDLYLGLLSHWKSETLVIGGQEPSSYLNGTPLSLAGASEIQRMMALDAITYLPDDILVKNDRAAMGVSLEGRAPFLDHRVVEFAWSLPQQLKLRNGVGKWALRQVLYRHVPSNLIERPKMGFGVPIDSWLRGPLREWAEGLLDESKLRQGGYFDSRQIRQKWVEHVNGKRNWHRHLWDVLMFQAWLEAQG